MTNLKNFRTSLRPFYQGVPVIILCVAVALFIAKRYLKYCTPLYESTAKIKLADSHEGVGNSNLYKDLDVFVSSNKVSGEVEMMKSKVIIQKAISKLDLNTIIYRVGDIHKTELYSQSPFILKAALIDCKWADRPFAVTIYNDSLFNMTLPDGEKAEGKLDKMISTKCGPIFIILNKPLLQTKPWLKINDNYEFRVLSNQSILSDVVSNLDVTATDKDVPVLRISYKCPVPEKSADVVNAISAAYISDYIEEKYRSADTATVFLDRQLAEFSGRLSANENAIENYRDDKNIINIHQETETDLRKIADLQKDLASVEMNLAAIDTLVNYMNRGKANVLELAPNFQAFNDLLSTEMLKSIKLLEREKKDLMLRFTAEDEKVQVVDEKIADLTHYIVEGVMNTKANLEAKHNDLLSTIRNSEQAFVGLPNREKRMAILDRNFSLNEQIYRFLHEKRAEAEIAKAATISFHRIISVGEIPKAPVSPSAPLIMAMAFFLGMLSGIAVVYGWHKWKAVIASEAEIYKTTAIPVSQLVPFFGEAPDQTLFFRKWALELELKGFSKDGSLLAISSYNRGEGKRFMTANLAQALQQLGKKVLVVDADGALAGYTATDYCNLQQAINPWYQPAVWLKMVQDWKAQYDVILVKNFPVSKEPTALLLMSDVEQNLVVLDSLRTKKSCIDDTEQLQHKMSISHIEFVLNRADYSPGPLAGAKQFITKNRKAF